MYFTGTHMTNDSFHSNRADCCTPVHVGISRKKLIQETFYRGQSKKYTVEFVILPADAHAEIMHARSKNNSCYTVCKRSGFFSLQACGNICLVQNCKHRDGIVGYCA